MTTKHRGMTLFELLIVMIIVGIVYSIGVFSMKKNPILSSDLTLENLKTVLLSNNHIGNQKLICNPSCTECDLYSDSGDLLKHYKLKAPSAITRYTFNRDGEPIALGLEIYSENSTLKESCFTFTLYQDGIVSPLLLKSQNTFYLYPPLGDKHPLRIKNEDELRAYYFNEDQYPLRSDDYHAAQ